jgi:thiosulfate/3-mercaptopyruvate sulfurtransferase
MTIAHVEVIADPSIDPQQSCGDCHEDVVSKYPTSLHATFGGLETALLERAGEQNMPALASAVENHCAQCHTTCGQCHVSVPTYLGGGLTAGHRFTEEPPMVESCTACHGTRVGQEYLGKHDGIEADVHWEMARMLCTDCHGVELHGSGQEYAERYDKAEAPRCEDCHQAAVSPDSGILQHAIHGDSLSCQTCHSQTYKNCYSCHVGIDEQGVKYFRTEPSVMDFKIGRNADPSPLHPYDYSPVRHAPIDRESFAYYGENLLPNFDARATWRYATPHNIRRITPQNQSCDSCHGNDSIFLTADDVRPEEQKANEEVVVPGAPGLP